MANKKRNFYIVRLRSVGVFRTMVSRCRSGSDKYKKYDVDIVPEEEEDG